MCKKFRIQLKGFRLRAERYDGMAQQLLKADAAAQQLRKRTAADRHLVESAHGGFLKAGLRNGRVVTRAMSAMPFLMASMACGVEWLLIFSRTPGCWR